MICNCCQKEIKDKFEILLEENVSGMVVCDSCMKDNHEGHIESQIKWLQERAANVRNSIRNINERYNETLNKLDD